MHRDVTIHWFRQDLRLSDNPALFEAAKLGCVLPVYILDDEDAGEHRMGAASRWWLHRSLQSLNDALGGKLSVHIGSPTSILCALAKAHNVTAVHWNRCYEPWRIQRDQHVKRALGEYGIKARSFNGSLLWEPWQVVKGDGTPYRVFTAFYRRGCLKAAPPRFPLPVPAPLDLVGDAASSDSIDGLGLLPTIRWDRQLVPHWTIGEQGAQATLAAFLAQGIVHYKAGRDFPAKPYVSRLSPYLRFGEVSPHQLWYAVTSREADDNVDHFCSELGWREFSYSLLYHSPHLPDKNLQTKFDAFPWREDAKALARWQHGQTGVPIVDAGMRELWQTGYMHNRVRMIVGSYLVKNLRLHWRHGARWFWDCLVDADLANNSAGWQWVAGCGADAAPYFRIFNPVTQGQKFDGGGDYTRRYVSELAGLPDKYLFSPWQAPDAALQEAGVVLGETYPKPIVDLKSSRERALAAFRSLK